MLNLRDVIRYLMAGNFSEIITVLVAALVFPFMGAPLTATQLLWINLVSDGVPALALGWDDPDLDVFRTRPGYGRDVLSRAEITRLLIQAAWLALGPLSAIAIGRYVLDGDVSEVRTMAFVALVVAQLFHAFNVRSSAQSLWNVARRAPLVAAAVAVSLTLQALVLLTATGRHLFELAELDPVAWSVTILVTVVAFLSVRWSTRSLDRREG